MRWELLGIAVLAGAATWAFRALPIMLYRDKPATRWWLERGLAAMGPAAIATLFAASLLPLVSPELKLLAPVIGGTLTVIAVYVVRPSVVLATLAGAVAHGVTVWLLA